VIYGEAKGKLAPHARTFSAIRFLEAIVEQVAGRFAWPSPITIEMRSCGEPNARWTIPTRRFRVCYELAQEFVELYGDFGGDRTLARASGAPARFVARSQNIVSSVGAWKRLPGPKHGRQPAR
jgi:Putative metallopeptidase